MPRAPAHSDGQEPLTSNSAQSGFSARTLDHPYLALLISPYGSNHSKTRGSLMRIRALLIACLVAPSSLMVLPANASGAIQFRKIQYDTPGADKPVTNTKLNAEYVTIKNTGTTARTLTGWTVRDPAHHGYTFPAIS